MVVKLKQKFEKTRHVKKTIFKKIMNLKRIFYVDKEMQDIMIKIYPNQDNDSSVQISI